MAISFFEEGWSRSPQRPFEPDGLQIGNRAGPQPLARDRYRRGRSLDGSWAGFHPRAHPLRSLRRSCQVQVDFRFGDLFRSAKPVANASFRQNELRARRIGFDLSPELLDTDPQVLRVVQMVPKLTDQEIVRHHPAGVHYQYTQHIVFSRCESNLPVTHLDDATQQVDG